jgi:hypothetical protein
MTPSSSRRGGADLSALRDFLDGYLHQDFVSEHRTVAGAVRAFLHDANQSERRRLRAAAAAFLTETRGMSWEETRTRFVGLGGAWSPRTRAALKGLFTKLIADPARR